MVVANMDGPTRDQVLKLIQEKDKIESEIAQLGGVLERNHIGMQDSLVDENGFPRNDIDVYQVRHARHRIICLQNDHKALMKQIEKGLHTLHSQQRGSSDDSSSTSTSQSAGHSSMEVQESSSPVLAVNGHSSDTAVANCITGLRVSEPKVIAKVNFVSAGSPAEDAGIKVDDHIMEFGSLNPSNFKALTQIAEIVQHSVNTRINVKILRPPSQVIEVSLTPHTWSGRGLLGCNIIPLDPL